MNATQASVLLTTGSILAMGLIACAPGKVESPGQQSLTPQPAKSVIGKGLETPNAKKLIANTWCMVNDSGETFHNDVAIGYAYSADAASALRFMELDRSKGTIQTKQIDGKWGIEGDRLTIFDSNADQTFVSVLSWFKFTPKIPVHALWKDAIAKGEQLCLRAQNAQDPKKFGIHCRCDLGKIKK